MALIASGAYPCHTSTGTISDSGTVWASRVLQPPCPAPHREKVICWCNAGTCAKESVCTHHGIPSTASTATSSRRGEVQHSEYSIQREVQHREPDTTCMVK
eukprot:354173-Chlamydomonas_euryale.AAC.9